MPAASASDAQSSSRTEVMPHVGVSRRGFLRAGMLTTGGAILGPAFLAACSGSSKPGNAASTAAGGAHRGGTLKLGTLYDPVSYDPYVSLLSNSAVYPSTQSLWAYYQGSGMEVVPGIAESWTVSSDGTSMTVKLRSGVKYHSGDAVTTDDMVAVVNRALSPDLGLQLHNAVSFIKGASKVDASTIKIDFTGPTADEVITDLLIVLPIIPKAHNNAADLAKNELGAGPFKLVTHNPGVQVQLARFDQYWQSGIPYLDGVTFHLFDDVGTMTSALSSGEIDGALYVPAAQAQGLKSSFNVIDVSATPGAALMDNVLLNTTVPPFDNKLLRHAIQRCIDRDRIIKEVAFGYGKPIVLPFVPGSDMDDPSLLTKYSFDLDEAKKLFQAAGSPASGQAIVQGTNAEIQAVLQIIQADLKKIGFNLKISPIDQQTFNQRLLKGDFGMLYAGIAGNMRGVGRGLTNPGMTLTDNVLFPGGNAPEDYISSMKALLTRQSASAAEQSRSTVRSSMLDSAQIIGVRIREQLYAVKKTVHDLTNNEGMGDGVLMTKTWIG